jgi:hypothetical protein
MAIAEEDKAYLGGISVQVKTPNFTIRGRETLRAFRRDMRVAHSQGIEEGRDILQDVLYEEEIFDTGTLISSVASRLFIRTTEIFEGTVHFNNPGKQYAYFVEHGRGAGLPPPIEAMKEWGKRKGMTLIHILRIRRKIADEGTRPHPFMSEASRRITDNYNKIVDRAVERFRIDRKI